MREVEGAELYWTWIGKIVAVVCESVKLVSRRILYEVTKNVFFWKVVVEVLIWL